MVEKVIKEMIRIKIFLITNLEIKLDILDLLNYNWNIILNFGLMK